MKRKVQRGPNRPHMPPPLLTAPAGAGPPTLGNRNWALQATGTAAHVLLYLPAEERDCICSPPPLQAPPRLSLLKKLLSSCVSLLENHTALLANASTLVSIRPPAINPFHPLAWHAPSAPVRERSWPLQFLSPCLFPCCTTC